MNPDEIFTKVKKAIKIPAATSDFPNLRQGTGLENKREVFI